MEDEFEKIKYVGRHSAAQLGSGFQTRPLSVDRTHLKQVCTALTFLQLVFELCVGCCHGLKMCIYIVYDSQIDFCH